MTQFFSVLVAGDDYQSLMDKYDANIEVEPYVRHKFNDKEKNQKQIIEVYENILKSKLNYSKEYIDEVRRSLNEIKKLSSIEFYMEFTKGLYYDEETGDALSVENPDGKWSSYSKDKQNFTVPFLVKPSDGDQYAIETTQAKKGDIVWELMHRDDNSVRIYERSWDLIMGGVEPIEGDEDDARIINYMGTKELYFSEFKNKEEYVNYSTSYKASVFLDANGWHDINDINDENHSWGINFYDKFIKDLPDETILTILECHLI